MNVETLKFLLVASDYLKVASFEPRTARDLQAVERALPDCDWFELAESAGDADSARRATSSLRAERMELEF